MDRSISEILTASFKLIYESDKPLEIQYNNRPGSERDIRTIYSDHSKPGIKIRPSERDSSDYYFRFKFGPRDKNVLIFYIKAPDLRKLLQFFSINKISERDVDISQLYRSSARSSSSQGTERSEDSFGSTDFGKSVDPNKEEGRVGGKRKSRKKKSKFIISKKSRKPKKHRKSRKSRKPKKHRKSRKSRKNRY